MAEDDGWKPWDGKRPFRGSTPLSVRFRNGRIAQTHQGVTVLAAHKWHGVWDRGDGWPWDIVAVKAYDG